MSIKLPLKVIPVENDYAIRDSVSTTVRAWSDQIPEYAPGSENFQYILQRANAVFKRSISEPAAPVVAAYDQGSRLQGLGWFDPNKDGITHVHGLLTAPHNFFETPPMTRGVGTCLLAGITLLYPNNPLQLIPLTKELYTSLGFQPGPTAYQMTLPVSGFPALQARAANQLIKEC